MKAICEVSVTTCCKLCDGPEAREARGAAWPRAARLRARRRAAARCTAARFFAAAQRGPRCAVFLWRSALRCLVRAKACAYAYGASPRLGQPRQPGHKCVLPPALHDHSGQVPFHSRTLSPRRPRLVEVSGCTSVSPWLVVIAAAASKACTGVSRTWLVAIAVAANKTLPVLLTGVLLARRACPPKQLADGTSVPPPALCIHSECRAARNAVVSSSHSWLNVCCRRPFVLHYSVYVALLCCEKLLAILGSTIFNPRAQQPVLQINRTGKSSDA